MLNETLERGYIIDLMAPAAFITKAPATERNMPLRGGIGVLHLMDEEDPDASVCGRARIGVGRMALVMVEDLPARRYRFCRWCDARNGSLPQGQNFDR